jgi:hypothetical protein
MESISIDLSTYDKETLIDIILYSVENKVTVDIAIADLIKQAVASKETECLKRMQKDWDSNE